MNVLLDTHTVLWAFLDPTQLSKTVTNILEEETTLAFVSVASAWEISTKVRKDRLPGAELLEANFERYVLEAGYTILPIDLESALRAGRFQSEHRDPLDRMIAAQALTLDVPVLSIDRKLDSFGVRRIW